MMIEFKKLIAYVRGEVAKREEFKIDDLIIEDKGLREIVEGIKYYEKEAKDLSLEDYVEQQKKENWKKISTFLDDETTTTKIPNVKTFFSWIKDKEHRFFVFATVGIIMILTTTAIFFGIGEDGVKKISQASYIIQALVLTAMAIFFYRNTPSINPNPKFLRPSLFGIQLWHTFNMLLFSWGLLYAILTIYSFYENNYLSIATNFCNNLTTLFLFLCYFVLNNKSLSIKNEGLTFEEAIHYKNSIIFSNIVKKSKIYLVAVSAFLFIEIYYSFIDNSKEILTILPFLYGIVCAVATAGVIRRIGSKFYSKENWVIDLLLIYVGIQALYPLIVPHSSDVITIKNQSVKHFLTISLVTIALLGKLLLTAFIVYGKSEGSHLYYGRETSKTDEVSNEERVKIKYEASNKY